ncbi:hypothetical protein [Paenibacillus naphthalenovorans]|uniref:Uncharacterized protein n=1 Tax=Paenibacillus naphthalenovorans TaxID=162209 RepID=A0A0U2W3Y4_9BACL|nr:hypothetical protein [Paenibacillus naphthalenovorans]ALS22125.1 hypothetical protein IJ22_17510 [Paenibacillus naphthalenovorans]
MNRITPEMVLKAYQKTGLKPIRGEYFSDGCACGMGAIYKLHGGNIISGIEVDKYTMNLTSINYMEGFYTGFDGKEDLTEETAFNKEEWMGYVDGKAAWEAVKHLV